MKLKLIILLSFMNLILFADVISKQEILLFNEMLQKVELDTLSLNFPKDWASSEFKIQKIVDILEHPLEFPKFIDETKSILQKKQSLDVINFGFENILSIKTDSILIEIDTLEIASKFNKIKNKKDIINYTITVYEKSFSYFNLSCDSLSSSDKNALKYFFYSLREDYEDSLKYNNFYSKNELFDPEIEIEDYIKILKKVDFNTLFKASYLYNFGMEKLSHLNIEKWKFKKSYKVKTKFGLFVIGSQFDDVYQEKTTFIFEPAGNDQYYNDLSTNDRLSYCTILDFSGDDIYINDSLGSLFNIIFGFGYLDDKNGNDYYFGDDFTFSVNLGSLVAIDENGNDTYITGKHSLGSATFGVNYFCNINGNDIYSSTEYSQGFAGPYGFGILADNGHSEFDNDTYKAGGKYLHAPLAPNDYKALSQGFGFGVRPDMGGGFGIIFDENGNDNYDGGVYSQGVGYWYGLGALIDLKGNDFYNSVYYPQGSGIHLACGFLYDEDGEDSYYSKHGPGQGAGHDYGVGFLVDRNGNDAYSIEGGNGLGLTNSVGIFLDVLGNDRYEHRRLDNFGQGKIARQSGSIGLFLDTNGNDSYPYESIKNDTLWIKGSYGVGKDTLFYYIDDAPKEEEVQESYVDSLLPIEDIFAIASQWEVGSARLQVRNARNILLKRELEASEYIFKEKLDTKSGLELRAILELTKNSKIMQSKLSEALESKNDRTVGNTIFLIGEIGDLTYIARFKEFLKKEKYVGSILSALGNFKTEESIDILSYYVDNKNVYWRVITARSLKKINTDNSFKILYQMKNDDCFLINSMIRFMEKK